MDLLHRLLTSSRTMEFLELDAGGHVVEANAAFLKHRGVSPENGAGLPVEDFLVEADLKRVRGWIEGGAVPENRVRLNFLTPRGSVYSLSCLVHRLGKRIQIVGEPESEGERSAAEELVRLNNEFANLARERTRQQRDLARTRDELESALEELKHSYWHLQKIQEVMPLCMRCGMIKTDEATWQPVVHYLRDNEIFLSHGYCPECVTIVEREYGLTEGEDEVR